MRNRLGAAMVMKIYGTIGSNVQRVISTLFEAGVDVENEVELVFVDLLKGDNQKPDFLAKQPFGKIPCFEEGDFILYESRAIARYLAERYEHQGVPLLGKTPQERAIIDQWCEVESQNFNTAINPMFREMYIAKLVQKRPVNEELVASCLAKTGAVLDVYERHLSMNKFIAGSSYSLADLFHISALKRLMDSNRDIFMGRQHVLAWAESLIVRPALQKTLEVTVTLSSK